MQTYTASDIKVLKGLDAVRLRPGMYIGSTGSRGLHHLLWEIVDNAIDEASNGFGDKIDIIIHKDNSITVVDNGRGIPVGMHDELNISGVEVVFTQLHAGGKFSNDNYGYSGGLHGVGAAVVNALSEWLVVEVCAGAKRYTQRFESYFDNQQDKIKSGEPVSQLELIGRTTNRGTKVTFFPDRRVFETIDWNYDLIVKRLQELAYLNSGVQLSLTDERKNKEKTVFLADGGISDFVKYLNTGKNCIHAEPIIIEGVKDSLKVNIAIQYNDSYTESIYSYVNNIPTTEGGTHETGFKTALAKTLNEYCRKNGLIKEKESNLEGSDFREGITAVISLKMKSIQFEGQTKTKLGNTEARTAVEQVLSEQLGLYLQDLRNQNVANTITEKAIKAAKVREATRKAKSMARQKSKLENAPLVGKLSSCTGRDKKKNELYLVEGDSAGGSAKQGRDRYFQAILPLRGKPLNAEKKRLDQVLSNDEFRSIITALGTGIDSDFNIDALKYDKVIILSDADQDGAHIRAILLTFFFRYMKPLIMQGHLYIGLPPLYKVSNKKKTIYAYDDSELKAAIKSVGAGYKIQRYKGLGEMNASQLWDTTMNPENRNLIKVEIEDFAQADRIVTILMGDKAELRKSYISEYADFDLHDAFEDIILTKGTIGTEHQGNVRVLP